jgi:hypothetical protein
MWYYFKEDYKSFLELGIAHESLKKLQKTFKIFKKLMRACNSFESFGDAFKKFRELFEFFIKDGASFWSLILS